MRPRDIEISIFGNWKMNYGRVNSVNLARNIESFLSLVSSSLEVGVCPTFTSLYPVYKALGVGSKLRLCAQNCHSEEAGSFTGEIAANMLAETCQYVLLGHSERRTVDTSETANLNNKIAMVVKNDMVPILCVGEEDIGGGVDGAIDVVVGQVMAALEVIGKTDRVVIAYEPVWAIGSGRGALPHVVKGRLDAIRERLVRQRGPEFGLSTPILYGGSVSEINAVQYIEAGGADGLLVGAASLDYKRFTGILSKVSELILNTERSCEE